MVRGQEVAHFSLHRRISERSFPSILKKLVSPTKFALVQALAVKLQTDKLENVRRAYQFMQVYPGHRYCSDFILESHREDLS
jgi:hypothetical protein